MTTIYRDSIKGRLLSMLLILVIAMAGSCKKEERIVEESKQVPVIFAYEVTCDYCDISYVNAGNQTKTIKNNMGKWSYQIEKRVTFDLKLNVSTIASNYQSIQAYILKDEEVVCGNLGYYLAEISYNTVLGNGTASFGSYISNTQSSGNNSGGTTAPNSSVCGAKNKTGGYCKRVVVGGGRCWQHK